MYAEIEMHRAPHTKSIIFLYILCDIIVFVMLLPGAVVHFCIYWQRDLADMGTLRNSTCLITVLQTMLIFGLLRIVISRVYIWIKLIGITCVGGILQWITTSNIPKPILERELLSPLKEQCYFLIDLIPLIAIGLCGILLILLVIFGIHTTFSDMEVMNNNNIVIFVIFVFTVIIVPVILRPFITLWL